MKVAGERLIHLLPLQVSTTDDWSLDSWRYLNRSPSRLGVSAFITYLVTLHFKLNFIKTIHKISTLSFGWIVLMKWLNRLHVFSETSGRCSSLKKVDYFSLITVTSGLRFNLKLKLVYQLEIESLGDDWSLEHRRLKSRELTFQVSQAFDWSLVDRRDLSLPPGTFINCNLQSTTADYQ